ncbi:AMP-binding protein [Naasia aerilata]|uniref:Fatty-acyl-CoA synthase n=1 Tax=Naasia aerilata TaxID=1162966 RepID=A0ABM8GAC0_9MICO|nr:fatty-acyl-CoA synthase [Naasia aerilata]
MTVLPEGIGGWLRRRAVSSASGVALVFRDAEIGYAELADRVDRLAAALQQRGIRAGDRVAYLGNNHPSFVEALFATARIGAVFVPLNTRLSVAELGYMLTDSGAALLLNSVSLDPIAAGALREAGRPATRIVVGEADADDPVVPDADAERYEDVLRNAPAEPVDLPAVTLEDRALIIYTSGTTGRPKGAVLTHGNLTWNAVNVIADYDLAGSDRALMISPLFHVASLGMGCLPVLLKGGTVLLEERFLPGGALAAIERLRATAISGVPTTYQLMLDDPAWAGTDLSSLRMLTCGGSPVPARVRDAYEARGLAFSGGYGLTETAPGVTMLPARFSVERAGSAGLAHSFTQFRIAGADDPGVLGEIEVRGPNVFLEYWGNPDATAAAFTEDGWFKTGDIGYTDDRGFLFIADRVKDMIISGGENIYSAEVEMVLLALEG